MRRGWRAPLVAAVAVAAAAFAGGALATAAAGAGAPTKTLTVNITSGPEGTVSTPDVSFAFSVEGTEAPGTDFSCALDSPLALKSCTSPISLGPLPSGSHTFYAEATNAAANAYSALASRTFTVAAAHGGGGSGGGNSGNSNGGNGTGTTAPPQRLQPTVASLAQSATRWREGSALARLSRAGAGAAASPRGTTFSFTLNETASVRLAFTQALAGRSVGGRCVAPTRANTARRACTRNVAAGTLTLAGHAGSDRVRFQGRLSASRRLKPGRYTVALSASAGGLTSTPRSLTFTTVA